MFFFLNSYPKISSAYELFLQCVNNRTIGFFFYLCLSNSKIEIYICIPGKRYVCFSLEWLTQHELSDTLETFPAEELASHLRHYYTLDTIMR